MCRERERIRSSFSSFTMSMVRLINFFGHSKMQRCTLTKRIRTAVVDAMQLATHLIKSKRKRIKHKTHIFGRIFSVYSVLCEHDYCTFNLFIFWILNLIPRIINYGSAHAIDGNMNKFMKTSTVFHSTEKYILEKWKIYETQKQYDELEKMRLSLSCWFWMAIKIDKVFFIHCNT